MTARRRDLDDVATDDPRAAQHHDAHVEPPAPPGAGPTWLGDDGVHPEGTRRRRAGTDGLAGVAGTAHRAQDRGDGERERERRGEAARERMIVRGAKAKRRIPPSARARICAADTVPLIAANTRPRISSSRYA